MSPTSCRCSTPRRVPGGWSWWPGGLVSGGLSASPVPRFAGGRGRPRRPRLPGGRPPSTLRRCAGSRPGSGWDRVGPARSRPRAPPTPRAHARTSRTHHCRCRVCKPCAAPPEGRPSCAPIAPSRVSPRPRVPTPSRPPPSANACAPCPPRAAPSGADAGGRSVLGHEHGSAPVGYPPSTRRLVTRSSPGGLTLERWGSASWGGVPA